MLCDINNIQAVFSLIAQMKALYYFVFCFVWKLLKIACSIRDRPTNTVKIFQKIQSHRHNKNMGD